jgi:hypothetical protein
MEAPISTMKKFLGVFWTDERASSGVPEETLKRAEPRLPMLTDSR